MKRLLAILFCLVALPAFPASVQIIRGTITVTNAPTTNGMAAIITHVGGTTTRTYTNDATGLPLISIATNLTIAGSATNLWDHLAASPVFSSYRIDPKDNSMSSNSVTIVSSPGGALSIVVTGFWARVSYATQTIATPLTFLVRVPYTVEASSNQVYIQSRLLEGIDAAATNSFSTNSTALANYISASPVAQSMGNKTLTNGVIDGTRLTNIVAANGTVFRLTNGVYVTPALLSPYTTNLTNFGLAISSPDATYASSERFGALSSSAGINSTAVGYAANGGRNGISVGYFASSGTNSVSVGGSADTATGGYQAIAIGQNSNANSTNGIAIGYSASVTHSNSVAIGAGSASTAGDQITIGSTAHTVVIAGTLSSSLLTNIVMGGTNINRGDISYTRYNNSSLANGNNAAVLIGTNVFMNVSGPTAAFTINGIAGGRDGKTFILQKTNSLTLTVANDSGTDPVAANRIYTGTGADITITNNPGYVQFIYNADLTRWGVLSKSN
jgi:hypothetical protein